MAKNCINPKCEKEIPSSATFCSFCGIQQVSNENLTEEEKLRKEVCEMQETIALLKKALADAQKNSDSSAKNMQKIEKLQKQLAKVEEREKQAVAKSNTYSQPPPASPNKSTTLIVVLIILVVIVAIIIGVWINSIRSEWEGAKQTLTEQQIDNENLKKEQQRRQKQLESEQQQLERKRQELERERREKELINIDMVFVQGGTFSMGCTSEQNNDCYNNEYPVIRVTVGDFYIGKYEVTQAQWKAVMGNNPSYSKGDNLPVENVYWSDVQTFIRKLNEKTGKQYRLPTEAEWEYAARGGNKSRDYKYSGSDSPSEVAWFNSNSGNRTHPVGTKQPNELGIYDMSGNVLEWCADYWRENYGSAQVNTSFRVNRGGKCISGQKGIRVADRGMRKDVEIYLGFRLACD